MDASTGITYRILESADTNQNLSYHGEFRMDRSGHLLVKHGGVERLFLTGGGSF